ncbi:MAG: DUF2793 domain-containing protein [Maricaulaceae bacterium]
MTFRTPNLDLPYIAPAQAQKHITHNETIRALDALVQLSVSSISNAPPVVPVEGERYIVGESSEGEFSDKANKIAAFQDGAWVFLTPQAGWLVYDEASEELYVFNDRGWNPVLPENLPQEFATHFGINATADDFNRLIVKSEASLFDHAGEGHQLKVNKSNVDKTASLLFQSNYQGHAEMGLTGSNDFAVRVSPDGSQFSDAMRVQRHTGDVKFPNGLNRDMLLGTLTEAGNGQEFYGFPNLTTVSTGQASITLIQNRVYFNAVFVDRPTEITGGFAVIANAGSRPDAILRLGIYDIGEPSGNNWKVGARRVDFGTQAISPAGGFEYSLSTPTILPRGWYMFALGVNGPEVQVRFLINYTPGLNQFTIVGTGTAANYRSVGPANYCFISNQVDAIENGFPSDWNTVLASDARVATFRNHMFFIPKFKHWNAT